MASPILHIKDSYYFEVPKSLYPVSFGSKADLVGVYETWLRLDPQYQAWEAARFYDRYADLKANPAPKADLLREYEAWKHDHAHAGKPFWRFLSESRDHEWFEQQSHSGAAFNSKWQDAIEAVSGPKALAEFRADDSIQLSTATLNAYSRHLSGKILIPQPFGQLRNLYEKESGFCISRFMLIEVAVALILWGLFSWLGGRVGSGDRPIGALWNLLESFVQFVRDQIARPVIGHEEPAIATDHGHQLAAHGDAAHGDAASKDGGHGHGSDSHAVVAHGADSHGGGGHGKADHSHDDHGDAGHDAHHHDPRFDADRFVPLLLTIFFFVLGCNLAGMLPWIGAPTGEWGTTSALAFVTFGTGVLFGMMRFGVFGYFANQIPGMDLPLYMAVIIKPVIFAIEILGLLIKHSILSIRLLANMVAGHIVLLSVMALAFSVEGAMSDYWSLSAVIAVVGSTLLSCLELFVAFLQAYIFTFLSAMFIGAAIHHH